VIADGIYDVFIVDATPLTGDPDPTSAATGWRLELTILAGDLKGEVVTLNAAGLERSEFDLIGMPGTLVVEQGKPAFQVDA
jgi:Mrp family chromosome partitioning ATPase